MRRWILLLLAAICFPGLAHSQQPIPARTLLVAQDVPTAQTSPENPAVMRAIAQVTDEATCWQLARAANTAVPNQVFFCVPLPPNAPQPAKPKGKYVGT